jgi:hypothetical protein
MTPDRCVEIAKNAAAKKPEAKNADAPKPAAAPKPPAKPAAAKGKRRA